MKFTRTEHCTERWRESADLRWLPMKDLVRDAVSYVMSPKAESLDAGLVYEVIIGGVIYIIEKTTTTKGAPHYKIVTIYKNSTQHTEGTFVTQKRQI